MNVHARGLHHFKEVQVSPSFCFSLACLSSLSRQTPLQRAPSQLRLVNLTSPTQNTLADTTAERNKKKCCWTSCTGWMSIKRENVDAMCQFIYFYLKEIPLFSSLLKASSLFSATLKKALRVSAQNIPPSAFMVCASSLVLKETPLSTLPLHDST